MGIQGLLPLLKSIMDPIHVKDFKGCCVAVDTYSWLHKGALSCSTQLCKGIPTSRHIDYCMHRVNMLRHYDVKPILVFDGGFLPMKGEQEAKRARSRKENFTRAIEHESNGNSAAAFECYQKAVDISPAVAHELIQVLKQENVDYIVAPYEADAQMTFLAVSKQVDAIITEDSDLIPFGCPRIIYKMDKFGQGVEFRYSMLQKNKELNFMGFTKQMLLEMCILSGCDYLQSLPGMGLKRAHALIMKFKSFDKVIKHLRYSLISVPPHYEEQFKKAICTFQHQRVYDPTIEDIVHLSDIVDDVGDDLDFLGPSISRHIAKGIARGDVDPFTKTPFMVETGRPEQQLDETYQLKNFKPERERKKLDLPAQKNLLTNYFCFASLEAKRKFQAPRITPKHMDPSRESSPNPEELVTEETSGDFTPKTSVEDGFASSSSEFTDSPCNEGLNGEKHVVVDTRNPQHNFLQKPGHSIHKPCLVLHKERDRKYMLEEKTRVDSVKVIVRSSYFQHKSTKRNDFDVDDNNLKLLSTDEEQTGTENREVIVRSPYFQPKLTNENDKLFIQNELKIRSENRKVTVRSSYFQKKSIKENDHDNTNDMVVVKGNATCDSLCENMPTNTGSKSSIMKRKATSIENIPPENVNAKWSRTDVSFINRGNDAPYNEDPLTETKMEGTFGTDISHLGQYADIAEKSIERFVSVLSSFKCPSSGSRPSGLRAPLKDVRNTCTSRSKNPMDISRFAYVPESRKTTSALRRG